MVHSYMSYLLTFFYIFNTTIIFLFRVIKKESNVAFFFLFQFYTSLVHSMANDGTFEFAWIKDGKERDAMLFRNLTDY